MLPPKVTVTIPAIRERRYVRREDGAPAAPPTPNSQLPPTAKTAPTSATSRQRIYIGKPGSDPTPTTVPPYSAPSPATTIAPAPAAAPAPSLSAAPAAPPIPEAVPPSIPVVIHLPAPIEAGQEHEVSAYTPDEARVLGTPRGLVPYAALEGFRPATPPADEVDELLAEEEAADEPAPAAAGTDPMLDEVIEGLRSRIAELKSVRRGPPSLPGDIAAPPTHATAGLMRAERAERSSAGTFFAIVLFMLVAGAFGYGGQYFRQLIEAPQPPPQPSADSTEAPSPSPAAPAATPAAVTWQDSDLQRVDAVLSAERALSLEEMGRLVGQLQSDRPGLPGLELLAARHALLSRRFADTEVRLSRLLAEAGDRNSGLAAELSYLRARNYAAQRKLLEARNCLDETIRRDPWRAEAHFEHGELNRRMGRMNEALADYDRALSRSQTGHMPSRAAMEFRRRLALVESDREAEIGSTAYMAELTKPNPAGEWVLTAAAVSLHRGDFAAGAQWMQRARSLMRPTDYLAAIEDYFFRNHASRPELKDAFPSPSERSAFILRTLPFLADP